MDIEEIKRLNGAKFKLLIGNQYDKLIVTDFAGRDKQGNIMWRCKCECGNEKDVRGSDLKNNHTRSCGCIPKWPKPPTETMDQKILKKYLNYNEETGLFKWITSHAPWVKIGNIAGVILHGYVKIRLLNETYSAHRLAWLYVHGHFPLKSIDHINGIKNDNRLINLREVTTSQNIMNSANYKNNTSGFKGVTWSKSAQKWMAQCGLNGKKCHLGLFNTPEEASKAYQDFTKKHFGEFFRDSKNIETEAEEARV